MKRLSDFGGDMEEKSFKIIKREKVTEVNYFERLPDELLVKIFEQVSEAKFLCMCYMVSRRFASLVIRSHTVSFKYPMPVNRQGEVYIASMLDKFLMKFVTIESLHVEQIYKQPLDVEEVDKQTQDRLHLFGYNRILTKILQGGSCISKWKAIGYQKSFVLLVVKRMRVHDNDDNPNEEVDIWIDPLMHQFIENMVGAATGIDNLMQQFLDYEKKETVDVLDRNFRNIHSVLPRIIGTSRFPDLKEATLTDNLNTGRVFIGEKSDFDTMRMSNPMTKTATVSKLWYEHVLNLPSGFIAEEALLAIIKCSSINVDDVSIAQQAFQEEEEKELCEVAVELSKLKPYFDIRN